MGKIIRRLLNRVYLLEDGRQLEEQFYKDKIKMEKNNNGENKQ